VEEGGPALSFRAQTTGKKGQFKDRVTQAVGKLVSLQHNIPSLESGQDVGKQKKKIAEKWGGKIRGGRLNGVTVREPEL